MIGKPRGRRGVNLQILPSAMTVLSICAGLTAIKFALEHQPKAAMALIAAAAILDGLDGRVARILDAQSRMGAEIDSLADAVNFGVTPALVLYVSMLSKWPVGWVVVLLYAVCVVLRLARYNALQDDGTQPAYAHEFFVGMPAPAGAVSMIGLLALKMQFGEGWWTSVWFLSFWVTGTSILLVSGIPMKKMHAVSVPPNYAAALLAVLAICAAAAVLAPYLLIWVIIIAYMCHIPFAVRSQRWLAQQYAVDADLIITSGGVSAGAYEVVKDAFGSADYRGGDHGVEFVKVAMQPGMPQGVGRVAGTPIVTLPGNPVSALVSFEVFIRPPLRMAMGLPDPYRPHRSAVLTASLTSPRGKRQFRRAILDHQAGTVISYGPPASHHLRWLASANGLLDIPEDVVEVAAGTQLQVWDLT